MNLNFSTDMEITSVGAKPSNDEESGDNILHTTVTLKVDDVQAKALLGEDFHRTAFGRMQLEPVDGETVAHFDFKTIDVGRQLDDHRVKILGYEFTAKPVLKKIAQVKGERAVRVSFKLMALMTEKVTELGGKLMANLGDLTKVHFFEAQQKLPLTGKADAKDAVVVNGKGRFGNPKPQTVAADATTTAS